MRTADVDISRRDFVTGAGAVTLAGLSRPALGETGARIKLRLLETSDLHMYVLDWDYYHAKTDLTVGFAKVASLIAQARAESANTLLFDNGDFLQGSALGDYIADQPRGADAGPHPIVAIFKALGYDAATLGNHEFNFGLPFLESALQGGAVPFVCANVTRVNGVEFLPPYAVLERKLKDEAGIEHILKIGVIGFVPPQILDWDRANLSGKLEAHDIVATARRYVPELRAKCDLMIALCHSGISAPPFSEGEENAALHLAEVPGFDAIFTGHAHRLFPGTDYAGLANVDAEKGRLNGVPAVMPGFWGSHLGLVDLTLEAQGDSWRVADAHVEARPIYRRQGSQLESLAADDPAVVATVAAAHKAALVWMERPVGALDAPVHSYFVWAGYDPASALVNLAQIAYVRPLLADTPFAHLPLLSAAAPFRAGATPSAFVDMPAGPTPLRAIADLYVFPNTVVAVKVTGAQIVDWLEFSAQAFLRLDPARSDPQPLVGHGFPSYNFDMIAGIDYQIDVTQPARYDDKGALNADAHRIVNVTFEGKPIDGAQDFVVVSNNYRADGGGGFPALKGATIALRAPDTNRDAVLKYFRSHASVAAPKSSPWSFAKPPAPLTVYFDTGPAALARLGDVAALASVPGGEAGFARVQFKLS